MAVLALVSSCLRLVLLVAGLLLPGAALTRVLRLPLSLGISFAASAVLLYASALALDFTGLPLSLTSYSAAIAVVTAALFWRGRHAHIAPPETPSPFAPFTRLGPLTPFFVLFWAIIAFLLVREPLAGPDTQFRWAFLPEQWLRLGHLDFYPPVTARDFLSYFWAESIPPGVASLHAWAFACGGNFSAAWTIPVTAFEFLALHDLAWRIGHHFGGNSAARASSLLLAACPLLAWSARLAQETGLTAIAALGIAFALLQFRAGPNRRWAAAIGIFAALGAITREYGLVFPALAVAALAFLRAARRSWLAFSLAAVPVALGWPLFTALRTGNPVYSLDLAGLFPVNPVFTAWVGDNRAFFSHAFLTQGWFVALRWLALAATPAVVGWILLLVFARKDRLAAFAVAAIAVFLALWLASVPYTVGGVFYTLRVANPALALGAVAAGVLGARVRPLLLGALLCVTLPFTLLLPQNPLQTPVRDWPAPWRAEPPAAPGGADEIVPAIVAQRAPIILTDSPGFQKLLAPHDVAAIPFWSPQVSWVFDPRTAPADAARRWRESGLHVLVLSKFPPALAFVNRHARWRAPFFRIRTVAESAGFLVLRIDAPAP